MAALGLATHIGAIRKAGAKPLLLALILFGWLIVGFGLILDISSYTSGAKAQRDRANA